MAYTKKKKIHEERGIRSGLFIMDFCGGYDGERP